ncbi:hypothetical protein HKX48_002193 [Thoreauomyces humboldtii]|nr:hypothetical protein HKX48_002193 [Thoreauomyces humboldtii]
MLGSCPDLLPSAQPSNTRSNIAEIRRKKLQALREKTSGLESRLKRLSRSLGAVIPPPAIVITHDESTPLKELSPSRSIRGKDSAVDMAGEEVNQRAKEARTTGTLAVLSWPEMQCSLQDVAIATSVVALNLPDRISESSFEMDAARFLLPDFVPRRLMRRWSGEELGGGDAYSTGSVLSSSTFSGFTPIPAARITQYPNVHPLEWDESSEGSYEEHDDGFEDEYSCDSGSEQREGADECDMEDPDGLDAQDRLAFELYFRRKTRCQHLDEFIPHVLDTISEYSCESEEEDRADALEADDMRDLSLESLIPEEDEELAETTHVLPNDKLEQVPPPSKDITSLACSPTLAAEIPRNVAVIHRAHVSPAAEPAVIPFPPLQPASAPQTAPAPIASPLPLLSRTSTIFSAHTPTKTLRILLTALLFAQYVMFAFRTIGWGADETWYAVSSLSLLPVAYDELEDEGKIVGIWLVGTGHAAVVMGAAIAAATGWTLRFLCFVLELLGGLGVARKLASDSNLFFNRGKTYLEGPTYHPMVEAEPGTPLESLSQKSQVDLKSLVAADGKLGNRIFGSVASFNEAYMSGAVTPAKVAEALISALKESEQRSPPLKAMVKYDLADIRKQANESTKRYAAGKPLSVLDGVPVAVKDEVDVFGYTTSVGTDFINIVPDRDAFCVSNLRRAGAVIIGKANMHEIGIDVTNINAWTGTPRNPYNPSHVTGGSSGGSACAVAAGLCPIAVGADGGGSIRIPAAYCGVYGLKPTAGRVSEHGAFVLGPTVGVLGPMGATAADMAIGYALMAGPDPQDFTSVRQPVIKVGSFGSIASLKGLRIGIYRPYFDDADPEIVTQGHQALAQFVERGAELVDIVIPELEEMRVAHANTITAEMGSAMAGYPRDKLSYPTRMALAVAGSQITGADYVAAGKIRTRGMAAMKEIYRDVDVIVSPSSAVVAPRIPEGAIRWGLTDYTTAGKAMRYIFMANLLGLPAVSVPIGYTAKDHLPIGLQFQAKWWDEETLLRLAHVSEDIFSAVRTKPEMHWDLIAEAKRTTTIDDAGKHEA